MYIPAYVLGPYTPYIHLEGMHILCCMSDKEYTLYISVCYLASKINTIIKSFVILQHSCTSYSAWCMGSLLSRAGS